MSIENIEEQELKNQNYIHNDFVDTVIIHKIKELETENKQLKQLLEHCFEEGVIGE